MEKGKKTAFLKGLQDQIHRLERLEIRRRSGVHTHLPFGCTALDNAWPEGGLPIGALHEISGGCAISGFPAATAFTGAIAGRLQRPVLWCTTAADFYGPGLAQIGLPASRLLAVRVRTDTNVLAVM